MVFLEMSCTKEMSRMLVSLLQDCAKVDGKYEGEALPKDIVMTTYIGRCHYHKLLILN